MILDTQNLDIYFSAGGQGEVTACSIRQMYLPVPTDPKERQEAAERLLQAFMTYRGRFNFACDLQCVLDEAVAGRPLYADGDVDGTLMPPER